MFRVDVLLVVGAKASQLNTVYTMHQAMSKTNTTLLVVDDVGDVLTEAVRLSVEEPVSKTSSFFKTSFLSSFFSLKNWLGL